MKRLILFRHAKSAYPDGVGDHERPLDERGARDAPRMGAYLDAEGLLPDRAIVSSARRTQETFALAGPPLGPVETLFEPRIFESTAECLLTVVRETPDAVRTLLLVGHNPGMEDLARLLIGYGDRYALARLQQKFPTAGIAVVDLDVAYWADVAEKGGRLDRFVTPEALSGEPGPEPD